MPTGFVPFWASFGLLAVFLLAASPSASAAPPVVSLSSPVGAPSGESWTGGSLHNVTWAVSDLDSPFVSFWINYSLDNGLSWSTLDNGTVPADNSTRSYAWTVPSADTLGALVRVCAADNLSADCVQSGRFEIDSTAPTASPSPPDGAAAVALGATVEVSFSEPMRDAPAPQPSDVTFVPQVNVTAVQWVTPTRLRVLHGGFASETSYAWHVSCSVRDDSDPGIFVPGCGASQWAFTTAPRPNAPPSVARLSVEGETGPPGTDRIENRFDPAFRWVFTDPDGGDAQEYVEWEILERPSARVIIGSGPILWNGTSISYAGPPLDAGSCYTLRLRVSDSTDWSPWASLDFCIASIPPGNGRAPPLVLYAALLPALIGVALISVVAAMAFPRWYGLAEGVSVGIAAFTLLVIVLELLWNRGSSSTAVMLQHLFAAAAILVPTVVHFSGDRRAQGGVDA